MQNRRDFIKQATLLAAGGVVAPRLLSSCGGGAKKYLGLQLYSLRDMVKDDGIEKVLKVVAKMGYNSLETAGYNDGRFYGKGAAELKKMVDDLGMKLTSSHLSRYLTGDKVADMAWWNRAVEAHNEAGMKYMVMPVSPMHSDRNVTIEVVEQYCDYFNEIAVITAGASIQFGYHNHDGEFTNTINDVPVFDLMVQNTSPNHVFFQLDTYWVKMGGFDPVDYMKKYPNRIKVLHIKDKKAIGVHNVVDFRAIYNQAYANGVKDWYVEVEDYDGTPEEDVKKSADYLLNADFVK